MSLSSTFGHERLLAGPLGIKYQYEKNVTQIVGKQPVRMDCVIVQTMCNCNCCKKLTTGQRVAVQSCVIFCSIYLIPVLSLCTGRIFSQ